MPSKAASIPCPAPRPGAARGPAGRTCREGTAPGAATVGRVIDLHTHSDVSDGTDAPADVVRMAVDAGLSALALTDHDTLDHVAPARAAAEGTGLRLVPGTELSCDTDGRVPGTVHLLVYFLDDVPGPLQDRLVELRRQRDARNERIVGRLRELGVDVTLEEVRAEAGAGTVGRPHVAAVLVRAGAAASIQDAFDRWLAKGRPAYFERGRLDVREAIALAHASGAVAVVAHPLSTGLAGAELDAFVAGLAGAGLDGLECDYGQYPPAQRRELRALAARHGLVATGGSDYHGRHKPGLAVGTGTGDLAVADEVLGALEARRPAGRRA